MSENRYYIRDRGKVRGPFDVTQLRALRDRGQFSSFHEISEDRKLWTTASALTAVFAPTGQGNRTYPPVEVVSLAVPTSRTGHDDDIAFEENQPSRRARAKLQCPRCDSRNVQSFEVIYEMGTSHAASNSVGFAPGVGMVFAATSGTQRTRAALNAAPPSQRDLTGPVMAIVLGAGTMLLAVLALLAGWRSGDWPGDSFAPFVFFFLFIMFVGLVVLIGGISSKNSADKWNRYEYPTLRETWLQSFRCLQCGHEFIPH